MSGSDRYQNPFRDLPQFSEQSASSQGRKRKSKQKELQPKVKNSNATDNDEFGVSKLMEKDQIPNMTEKNATKNYEDEFGISKIMEHEQKIKSTTEKDLDTRTVNSKRIKTEQDQKPKPKSVDTEAALNKIKPFLSKPKKFKKAAHLMIQLINAQLVDESSELFYDAFVAIMETCTPIEFFTHPDVKDSAIPLFVALEEKRDTFFLDSQQFELDTWHLRVVVANELNTDDTYQFSKSCRRLKQALETMNGSYEPMYERRKDAILLCMDVAFRSYIHAWAKVSIESTFKVARDKRLLFQNTDRDKVDAFTTEIVHSKGRPSTAGPKTVRTFESIVHPLRNKATTILR